jgi:hypothetical protein
MNEREDTGDTATTSNARPLPTVTRGGRTFTLLFHNLLRPLSADEWSRLCESIDRYGIQGSILCDENDGVIDGDHRMLIAEEKDIPLDKIPIAVRTGLTHEQKKELALSLNADRRQLSDEEIKKLREQRVERVAAARREGKSTRENAGQEKISDMQVRNDLKDATAKGFAVDPPDGRVKGKDGKKRRAKRRPVSFGFLDDATKGILGDHELTHNESVMSALVRLPFDKRESAARQLVASGAKTVKEALAILKGYAATAPQPDHVVAPAEAEDAAPPQEEQAPPVEAEEAGQSVPPAESVKAGQPEATTLTTPAPAAPSPAPRRSSATRPVTYNPDKGIQFYGHRSPSTVADVECLLLLVIRERAKVLVQQRQTGRTEKAKLERLEARYQLIYEDLNSVIDRLEGLYQSQYTDGQPIRKIASEDDQPADGQEPADA